MSLITLSDAQLALVRSTLQRQYDEILQDLNAGGDWCDAHYELLNDHHDLLGTVLKELNDCQTPKVIKAPTLQQQAVEWHTAKEVAKLVGISEKTLRNRKQTGKLKKNKHWKKQGSSVFWNLAAVHQFFSENSH